MIRLETSIISKFKKGDLEVVIEMALPGKTTRRIFRLGYGYEDRFPVNDPAEYLVITPPAGEDIQRCSLLKRATGKSDFPIPMSLALIHPPQSTLPWSPLKRIRSKEATALPGTSGGRPYTVFMENDLLDTGDGSRMMGVKHSGDAYNLYPCERFYDKPMAADFMFTGALVAPDVVATAAHFIHETNVRNPGFIFGYEMVVPVSPVTRFPNKKIFRGSPKPKGFGVLWNCSRKGGKRT